MKLPFAFLLLTWSSLSAQTAPQSLVFEVASVKPSPPTTTDYRDESAGGDGLSVRGYRVRNMPLSEIIKAAFGVKDSQLANQPDWLKTERFTIEAKPGDNAVKSESDVQLMLRNLLMTRFGLVVHRETREMRIYRLVVSPGGLKIKAEPHGAEGSFGRTAIGDLVTNPGGAPMRQLASVLAWQRETGVPVIDATNAPGNYIYRLQWTPDGDVTDGAPSVSLFTVLQEQLGLRLEAGKGPVEVLVIDHVEKVPTAN